MGVPSYFRWLASKYSKTVIDALEDLAQTVDGVQQKPDLTLPNPNGVEFDNLYLDMNGIIHPCSHPENKPQPASEYEIMLNIFDYVDRLFSIVRPRKVLYLAIDGVAPRAKMNQQRSRRFRAAKDSKDAKEAKASLAADSLAAGRMTQAEYDAARSEAEGSWHFDSNSITPGTSFMDAVAKSLRWYACQRLTTDPAWKNIEVIISDGNVPGEGEHKIMDWIRHQRSMPNYEPNTKHVLCGLDADLIMLGLATHEPHFWILREWVATGKENPNDRYAREGGQAEIHHPYQFLRLNVLREYLAVDLKVPNLPFDWDLERVIDDYVFLCFFVGNDFLPHMPTLEIREGAIELLIETYKKILPALGGYITLDGEIDLPRAEILLAEVGNLEDAILKRRLERNRQKQRRDLQNRRARDGSNNRGPPPADSSMIVDLNVWSHSNPRAMGAPNDPSFNRSVSAPPAVSGSHSSSTPATSGSNVSAAQDLKSRIKGTPTSGDMAVDPSNEPPMARAPDQTPIQMTPSDSPAPTPPASTYGNSANSASGGSLQSSSEITGFEEGDIVRLGAEGWKSRYYQIKFRVNKEDEVKVNVIAREYMLGLVWVLRYYYQGCTSWNWYYPCTLR